MFRGGGAGEGVEGVGRECEYVASGEGDCLLCAKVEIIKK